MTIGGMLVGQNFEGQIEFQDLVERDYDLLARCIEDASPRAAEDLSLLLSELQIQQARWRTTAGPNRSASHIVTSGNLQELIVDSIFISARARRLFFYSRREDKEYGCQPLKSIIITQLWHEIEEFQLKQLIDWELDNVVDTWLAPIAQRVAR